MKHSSSGRNPSGLGTRAKSSHNRIWALWIVVLALLLASCAQSVPMRLSFALPERASVYHLNLPALQSLRDPSADFSTKPGGADTGILMMPGEKVAIFASGSAAIQAGKQPTGPGGDAGF